ncbi:MAG: cellobiose phosphorylase [Candidatus Omnitrophica bacterium]|nr:cellobiose phosphorylase [Candidatus Omnitrophota bacterium]
MPPANSFYSFVSDGITFRSTEAMRSRLTYAPLCGKDGTSLKSAITPFLSGDIKVDKGKYLTKPSSREDLREPVRNFFTNVAGKGVVSFDDEPLVGDGSYVEIGQLWQRLVRVFPEVGLEIQATSLIPVTGEQLELTRFRVKNVVYQPVTFTPTAVVPIFGRALVNKHDHEHVTALLKRTTQLAEGVISEPTMLFNEEGHRICSLIYYVFGCEGTGATPVGSFPTVEDFFGEGGRLHRPAAIYEHREPRLLSDDERDGKEAVGALRFSTTTLKPGEAKEFVIAIGIADSKAAAQADFSKFASSAAFDDALKANDVFWIEKTSAVLFEGADKAFSSWMRWVSLQPILRRIFGCSFLPDHDYGKGGKGWRDIWQDLLSLILIEPGEVRAQLLNNFSGVRIDGSNATIIGEKPGEFIADRNAITRVWMDHGVWPFLTTLLYIDQSGDVDFLFEEATYFCDPQMSRSMEKNLLWTAAYGNFLKNKSGAVHRATVLEHILLQNLVQFFNVGEHNITRLESADWNDGLDMAFHRGESVAFMSMYAGNLLKIADLLENAARIKSITSIKMTSEMALLIDTLNHPVNYNDAAAKKARLFDEYFKAVQPEPSGVVVDIPIDGLVLDLRTKAEWIFAHIRSQEKITISEGGERLTWFNGYYDNEGVRVEGKKNDRVWMTLTGQVFPLMSGLAGKEEAKEIVKSVRKFLRDNQSGGFRLNTDFGLRHYLSMGRAFGFAFGTKENGAVFSHMAVMYAYGLYHQGFAREGHEVLRSLYEMSAHPNRAKIYPGIPEYFDSLGRGMYHFLTGSASWYVLTLLTQAYGVRGKCGDLILAPKLVAQEFNTKGEARVICQFAGKRVTVTYVNPKGLDYGVYGIDHVEVAGVRLAGQKIALAEICLPREIILAGSSAVEVKVFLS